MKEIKFTTKYEPALSFDDKDFKTKYEERVGDNPHYIQVINGDAKHLAICPQCNNPVVILGVYKKIDTSPHARHAKGIDIPNISEFNEYKYLRCPYHLKKSDYIKEYVPETEESQRQELFKIAKENYDKAIYLLKKKTGIHISYKMAGVLAENYVKMRAYNYIDATNYNIPWYLIYSFKGFPLHHMIIKKKSNLYKHLHKLGFNLKPSRRNKDCVYVVNNEGYLLKAINYRYTVDEDNALKEWLDFSILRPDDTETDTLLYVPIERFSVNVDSYYFGRLVSFTNWTPNQKLLDIAAEYMNP